MSEVDYGWLASLAEDMGKYDIAKEVRASKPVKQGENWFNDENLTKTKQLRK